MKPQPWLAPLTPIYRGLVLAKNSAYERGILSARHLHAPVISIGNLSTGGGGKTPLVIALAKLLTSAAVSVDVLSRGYGRSSKVTEQVLLSAAASADNYGDEPLLIARTANVPVFVGQSRFLAGQLTEKVSPRVDHIHLLDDGFQHRQLARDLDIVVLHPSDITAKLLPAGHLREPLASLRRAQVIVVREEDHDALQAVEKYLQPNAQVWRIRRTLTCPTPNGSAVAFCGIARPEEFFAGLRSLGVELAATPAYPDHHRYSALDVNRIIEQCRTVRATHLITTEKDAVRLSASTLEALAQSVTLIVARLEVSFLDPAGVLETVRSVLPHHLSGPEQ